MGDGGASEGWRGPRPRWRNPFAQAQPDNCRHVHENRLADDRAKIFPVIDDPVSVMDSNLRGSYHVYEI
jgi:hypothetical protein